MRTRQEDGEFVNSQLKGRTKFDFEERSGAGAISIECKTSYWTSTGANALTLADGSEGQIKTIVHAVDGGSLVITPANFGGATSATVTLATAGDSVTFEFLKGAWWVTAFNSNAAVTGSTVTYA